MGIIGYGSIGQACASIARAYRCGPLHDHLHLCCSTLASRVHFTICSMLYCCRMDIIALRRRPERSAEEQAQGLKVTGQPDVASRVLFSLKAKVCSQMLSERAWQSSPVTVGFLPHSMQLSPSLVLCRFTPLTASTS